MLRYIRCCDRPSCRIGRHSELYCLAPMTNNSDAEVRRIEKDDESPFDNRPTKISARTRCLSTCQIGLERFGQVCRLSFGIKNVTCSICDGAWVSDQLRSQCLRTRESGVFDARCCVHRRHWRPLLRLSSAKTNSGNAIKSAPSGVWMRTGVSS